MAVTLALVLALVGCPPKAKDTNAIAPQTTNREKPATPTFSRGVQQVDEMAPDFTLKDTEGGEITKADFSGKILVLDFWATWCDTCVEKLKKYEPIIESYKDKGVELIAVSLDSAPDVAAGWAKQTNSPYRIAMMDDTFKAAYFPEVSGQLTIPLVRIIDRDGNLRFKFDSSSVADDMDLALAQLVNEKVGGDESLDKPAAEAENQADEAGDNQTENAAESQ